MGLEEILQTVAGAGFAFGFVALAWAWAMVGFREASLARSKAKFYDAKAAVELSKAEQIKEGK